jgi:hypothetical protein
MLHDRCRDLLRRLQCTPAHLAILPIDPSDLDHSVRTIEAYADGLGEAVFALELLGGKHRIDVASFENRQALWTEQVVGTPLQEHEEGRRGARVDDDVAFFGKRHTDQIRENPALRRQGYRLQRWIKRLEVTNRTHPTGRTPAPLEQQQEGEQPTP